MTWSKCELGEMLPNLQPLDDTIQSASQVSRLYNTITSCQLNLLLLKHKKERIPHTRCPFLLYTKHLSAVQSNARHYYLQTDSIYSWRGVPLCITSYQVFAPTQRMLPFRVWRLAVSAQQFPFGFACFPSRVRCAIFAFVARNRLHLAVTARTA